MKTPKNIAASVRQRLRKRLKQEHIPESFAEITSEVQGFMKPIIQGKPSAINWLPAGPWS
jgi:hypothetical protein